MGQPFYILSLCDYSGVWGAPFRKYGYKTIQVDPKLETNIYGSALTFGCTVEEFKQTWLKDYASSIVGILMAPPCTHFCRSGNQHWSAKDADGRTEEGLAIVDSCLSIVPLCPNVKFWCLENPVGRLPKLRPLGICFTFHPCEYAGLADIPEWESYNKRTCLFGSFAYPIKDPAYRRIPTDRSGFGLVLKRSGGGNNLEHRQMLRSITPTGFARCFATTQIKRRL